MGRRLGFLADILRGVGKSCLGGGGFPVGDMGEIIENYEEEEWPEETDCGDEP